MAEHPNAQLLRKGYEAFGKGDLETVNELFADEIVWHEGGRNPLSGDYVGKDQVFGLLGRLLELTEGTFKAEIHDVVANDEHGIALATISASRKGQSFSGTNVDVWHLRDGRAVEFWDNPTDRYGIDDLYNA
jgi:ketosteroid isomerase-like protein